MESYMRKPKILLAGHERDMNKWKAILCPWLEGKKIINCRFNNILILIIQWSIFKIQSCSNLEKQVHGKGRTC